MLLLTSDDNDKPRSAWKLLAWVFAIIFLAAIIFAALVDVEGTGATQPSGGTAAPDRATGGVIAPAVPTKARTFALSVTGPSTSIDRCHADFRWRGPRGNGGDYDLWVKVIVTGGPVNWGKQRVTLTRYNGKRWVSFRTSEHRLRKPKATHPRPGTAVKRFRLHEGGPDLDLMLDSAPVKPIIDIRVQDIGPAPPDICRIRLSDDQARLN